MRRRLLPLFPKKPIIVSIRAMASKDYMHSKFTKQQRYSPYSKHNSPLFCSTVAQKEHVETCSSGSTDQRHGDRKDRNHQENSSPTSKTFSCISARQPYAGFILNGLKTIETRWTPVFQELEGRTVAIHVAWRDWEGGEEWKTILAIDHTEEDIERIIKDGEKHGRAVVAGLVDVGETWKCDTGVENEQILEWEKSALLRPLNEKFLTRLSNPKWLRRPLEVRGQRGIWKVEIPQECL
ncbi:uncharacterized protein CXorf40 homolog [Acanthaster planci]|uniref:Uncharacterized protein CXorf40 homolog n=1 Tax=Acanthaster planci TaxID=133434 RepID=A0A8B7Y4R6_ACAPL|nr:uncharacterized protein CXorf40 homolog [Acanthaster planci]